MNQKLKSARKKILFTMGISILLTLACIQLLPSLPLSPMKSDIFWANKVAYSPNYDIVIIGDSRIYRGLNPSILEREFNQQYTAFNFGFSSAGLDTFIINQGIEKLNKNGKKIILIGISASSFYEPNIENEHLHSLLQKGAKDLWVKQHIYPYITCFERYSILDFKKIYTHSIYTHDFMKNGWIASHKSPLDSSEALSSYMYFYKKFRHKNTSCSPFILKLKTLVKDGYTIYCFRTPTSFALKQLENKNTTLDFKALELQINQIGAHYLTLSNEYKSYDGSHLDKNNANLLSSEIAKQIKILMNNH
jgi:hypothetical protein